MTLEAQTINKADDSGFGAKRNRKKAERANVGSVKKMPAAANGKPIKVIDRLGRDISEKIMNFPEAKANVLRISEKLADREKAKTVIKTEIQTVEQKRPDGAMAYVSLNPMKVHAQKESCDRQIKNLKGKLQIVQGEIAAAKRELAGAKNTLEEASLLEAARAERRAKAQNEDGPKEANFAGTRKPQMNESPKSSTIISQMATKVRQRVRDGGYGEDALDLGQEQMRIKVRHTPESGGPSWTGIPTPA